MVAAGIACLAAASVIAIKVRAWNRRAHEDAMEEEERLAYEDTRVPSLLN
jgi:hypothetical protein